MPGGGFALPGLRGRVQACAPAAPFAVGYVEGDYVLLAPAEVAQVETVSVRRVRMKIYHEEPLPEDGALFAAYVRFSHGSDRFGTLRPLLRAACKRVMRGR